MKRNIGASARAVIGSGLLLFLGSGCGSSDGLATVTGTVRLDGKPLSGALVQFTAEGLPPSSGKTDENGNYELRRTRSASGASIGKNRVSVRTFREQGSKTPAVTVPAKYNARTELVKDVVAGRNKIDLELTSH